MTKFGNFRQTGFITVPLGAAFPWNHQGPKNGVHLNPANSTKIKVNKAGKYQINFEVFFLNLATSSFYDIGVQIAKNGKLDRRTFFGMETTPTSGDCLLLTGTAIINVPTDNTTLQLINVSAPGGDSTDISTCDNGPVAVTINLEKVD